MSFDFYEALHTSKLTNEKLRDLCGVSLRTFQRWVEKNDCPKYAQTIIECYSYDMAWMGKPWKGCYIDARENRLWLKDCPRPFSVGNIRVLRHEWSKLHWYYEVWIKQQSHSGWTHTPDKNIIQFELPLKLRHTG